MIVLLLLLAVSRSSWDAWLYPHGRAAYALHKRYRRAKDGQRIDLGLEQRYFWVLRHQGDRRRK